MEKGPIRSGIAKLMHKFYNKNMKFNFESTPKAEKGLEPEEIKREAGELVLRVRSRFFDEYKKHFESGNMGIIELGLGSVIDETIAKSNDKKGPEFAAAAARRFIDENEECSKIILTSTRKAVVESFQKHLNLSPEEIAERLGLNIEEVNQYLGIEGERKRAA